MTNRNKFGHKKNKRQRSDTIIAYPFENHGTRLTGKIVDEIKPGTPRREWMDETPHRFAYRCVPMTMANSLGWELLNPARCELVWNGDPSTDSLQVRFLDDESAGNPTSHFGSGIVTWNSPAVFRTPPGVGIMVTGPSNRPKRGITPLQGFVETDWLPNGFTMNWMITEPDYPIVFEAGEPFCRIFPYRKDYVENFQIELRDSKDDPEFRERVIAWTRDREIGMQRARAVTDHEEGGRGYWSGNYIKGRDTLGKLHHDHKNAFKCKPIINKIKR